jgi:hypothetical protein
MHDSTRCAKPAIWAAHRERICAVMGGHRGDTFRRICIRTLMSARGDEHSWVRMRPALEVVSAGVIANLVDNDSDSMSGSLSVGLSLLGGAYVPLWAGAVTESSQKCVHRQGRSSYSNFPISRAGPGLGPWSRRRYRIAVLILRIMIRPERFRNAWWSVDATPQPSPLSLRSPTAKPVVTR